MKNSNKSDLYLYNLTGYFTFQYNQNWGYSVIYKKGNNTIAIDTISMDITESKKIADAKMLSAEYIGYNYYGNTKGYYMLSKDKKKVIFCP